MTAYVVSDVRVLDPDAFKAYLAAVPAVLEHHGVEYVVRGGEPRQLEGSWNARRLVILRFRDREHVQRWYASAEYQEMIALRAGAAQVSAVVVDGVDADPTKGVRDDNPA
jgi:uncharacterized protein (DUF1330 family)